MKAITHLFEECTEKYRDNAFMWQKNGAAYQSITYTETRELVYQFAAGLLSLGIRKGDRIALLSEGCQRWVIGELGILYAGAVNVPLSVKLNEPDEIRFRLEHAGVRIIVVSHLQTKKIMALKSLLPSLEKIIMLTDDDAKEEKDIAFSKVTSMGQQYLLSHGSSFEEHWKSITGSDYANICYTSGTTADPKGIILTHRNYTANVEQSLTLMDIPEYYVSLLILPLDHAFAHTAGIYVLMSCGASMAFVETGNSPLDSLKNIPVNIREIKPHFLLSVPAIAKNFRKNIEKAIASKGGLTQLLFRWGLEVSYAYNGNGWDKGRGIRMILKPLVHFFDSLVFSKIRKGFGGNLRFFIGGGALLDIELQKFFYAIGIPMFQGYGLSESAPVISSNSESKHKLGSSGYLVKNLELRIADEQGNSLPTGAKGEIVVKGENIMAGYWNNPEATREALKDGWLYTGDLGSLDNDGFLYVYGRFKSLLIADDGEKYSPEGIEEAFVAQSPVIEQCMLYNNQNQYTVALIVPNKEVINRILRKHPHFKAETETAQALSLIQETINEYRPGNKYGGMFPLRWLPTALGIVSEPFSEENHMINSTLKMVRPRIVEHYQSLIQYLYTPEAKNILNRQNIANYENTRTQ